jgi:hypothetical protein
MQTIRNIIISIGVCLIGLLFVACSGSPQSAQVSQATIEATAIERSASEATATKRPTIKVTASFTRTPRTPRPTRTPIKATRTIGPPSASNITPVAELLGLPATPITMPLSEHFESQTSTKATSPDGRYRALFTREGVEILDEARVRIYRIAYSVSDFMFSPDSSQLAFQVYLNPDNWSIFIRPLC